MECQSRKGPFGTSFYRWATEAQRSENQNRTRDQAPRQVWKRQIEIGSGDQRRGTGRGNSSLGTLSDRDGVRMSAGPQRVLGDCLEGKRRQKKTRLPQGLGGSLGWNPFASSLAIDFSRHLVEFLVLGLDGLEALGPQPGSPVLTASHLQPGHWAKPGRSLVPFPGASAWGFPGPGPASPLLSGPVASSPTSIALSWKTPRGPRSRDHRGRKL